MVTPKKENKQKTPRLTTHHGKPVSHLDNEKSYKSHGAHGQQSSGIRHYNIPPGKKG